MEVERVEIQRPGGFSILRHSIAMVQERKSDLDRGLRISTRNKLSNAFSGFYYFSQHLYNQQIKSPTTTMELIMNSHRVKAI